MKILALADIHADESALDRLRPVAMRSNYDAVIVAGDLTNNGPLSFAEDLVNLFGDALYCVHGNMDPPEVVDFLAASGRLIHGKKVRLGNWNLVGFGGSNPTPFGTPSEMPEEHIAKVLDSAQVDEYTILVSHPPPKGVFDNVGTMNVGSTAVRACIEAKRPLAVICGHIHEHEGQKIIGDTLVIKLGPASSCRAAEITIGEEIEVKFIQF